MNEGEPPEDVMQGPIPIILIANYADFVGGGEESLLGLVRQLDRRRFLPLVLVPGEGELAVSLRECGAGVEVLKLVTVRPWTVPIVLCRAWALRKAVHAHRIRLVHAHGTRGALYAGLALWRTGIPLIWHVRVVDQDPWVDRLLLRLATAVVANSRATAARFGDDAQALKKVQVIYNGVDAGQFAPGVPPAVDRRALGIPEGRPLVVFAGRLEHGKGPDLFIETAAMIHRELPQAYFLLAGAGPMRETLRARGEEKGLPVVFVGRQANLKGVLGVADVLVVPSRQEAFGRVLIEAMAGEVPVVATRVGGIPEVCQEGQTGLLVTPEDPAALGEAVLETLHNAAATNRRVKAAAEMVRSRFSLEEHAARVSELYENLLQAAGHAIERFSSPGNRGRQEAKGLEKHV